MRSKHSFTEFKNLANSVHKYKYDYSVSDYRTVSYRIKIICPVHGVFEQRPNSHLAGYGCKKCSKQVRLSGEGLKHKPVTNTDGSKVINGTYIYVYKFDERYCGYGITSDLQTRHKQHERSFNKAGITNYELYFKLSCSIKDAKRVEEGLKAVFELATCNVLGFITEVTHIQNTSEVCRYIQHCLSRV